jgi:predicted transcriptional regulator of viral defense system
MVRPLDPKTEALARDQKGIVRREQLIAAGMSPSAIQRRIASGDWQCLGNGVYATFTGESIREAKLWTVVLRAGPGALLSHETAAELHGFAEKTSKKIHVTVPAGRHPGRNRSMRNVVIHRSRILVPDRIQAPWLLPRTSAESTVLDLVSVAETFDDAYAWICRGIADDRIAPVGLRRMMDERARMRWRTWLTEALADAESGVNSALELRYVRDVERAHGLPTAQRQARQHADAKIMYLDNLYEAYPLCVELDGLAYHSAENRWKDTDRDNANIAATNTRTMRYGWVANTERCCQTAQLVANGLHQNGWQGTPRPCKRGCPVR